MRRYIVGKVDDIPTLSGKVVHVGELELALFRLSTGGIRALENRCPHKGGPLSEGIVSGSHVFCPLHDWKICVSDGMVQAPDTGCVRTFPVEVKDDEISILLSQEIRLGK